MTNHIKEIESFLKSNITEMTNYKHAFKYPFIASEILCSNNEKIIKRLFNKEKDEKYPPILSLLELLDNHSLLNTTIPGYISKIIYSHMENELFLKSIEPYIKEILNILLENIQNDSYRNILYSIIKKGIQIDDLKDKYLNIIDDIFNKLNEIIKDEFKLFNIIWIFVALSKDDENSLKEIIQEKNLNKIIEIYKIKDENYMSDNNESKDIVNEKDIKCYEKLNCFFTNFLFMFLKSIQKDVMFENLNITSLIEAEIYQNNSIIPQVSNINKEYNFEDKTLIDKFYYFVIENFEIIYKVTDKVKKYSINNNQKISFCYLNLLDIINLLLMIKFSSEFLTKNIINEFYIDLINFPQNSILNQKLIQIFSSLGKNELTQNFFENLNKYVLENILNEDIIKNEVINKKITTSLNYTYLLKMFYYLNSDYDNTQLKEYMNSIEQGLFEGQIQPQDTIVQKDEDAEPVETKKDIHDSEAFIFTTKKILEDSKKVSKKLMDLDEI